MSLVYHGYRVDKEDLWDAVEQIREIYRNEHPSVNIINEAIDNLDPDTEDVYDTMSELVDVFVDRHSEGMETDFFFRDFIRLQVYDLGDELTFRVLEPGYFFGNEVSNRIDQIERLYYDGRSDITEEEKSTKPLVDRVVELQEQDRYMTIPVLSYDDLNDIWMFDRREDIREKIGYDG
jgi:hypothetical protein